MSSKQEILSKLAAKETARAEKEAKPSEGQPEEAATQAGEEAEGVQGVEAPDVQARAPEGAESDASTDDAGPITLADLARAQEMELGDFLSTIQGTVTIDGQSKNLTVSEIIAGYQRQKDSEARYQQARTLAAQAEQREALIHEKAAQLDGKLAEAESYLAGEAKQLEKEFEAVDWATMEREEPERYAAEQIKYIKRMQSVQAKQRSIAEDRQRMYESQQKELEQAMQAHVAQQRELLLQAVPEWNTPETFEAESQGITDYLRAYGASDKDIQDVGRSSAWLLRAIRDGYKHQQLSKQATDTTKRIRKVAKVLKPQQAPDQAEVDLREKQEALRHFRATRGQRRSLRDPAILAAAKAIGIGERRK